MTPTDIEVRRRFDVSVRHVRRNRYFIPEKAGTHRAIKPRRKRIRWRLETSCWAERLTKGNSLDFFETTEALRRMFMVDWDVARRSHELAWSIVKWQHEPSTWRDLDRNSVNSGAYTEVDEVREALWQHHRMIYGAFDYYSVLYSENENAPGEPDVFNMSFNAFMTFCEHARMISKRE